MTAGLERGWVWTYSNIGEYAPVSAGSPAYFAGATIDDRLRINEEYAAERLAISNRVRFGFWAWYRSWLEEYRVTSA